jgi:hypothetical protein
MSRRRRRGSSLSVAAAIIVLGVVLALQPVPADRARAAAPDSADGYARRVERAAALVAEAKPRAGDRQVAGDLAREVSALLPDAETVTVEGRAVEVRDAGMRSALAGLRDAGSAEARRAACERLETHLGSLRGVVGPVDPPAPSDPKALVELLAAQRSGPGSSDLSRRLNELFAKLLAKALEWFQRLSAAPGGSAGLRTVTVAVLVLLSAVLMWIVARTVRGWRSAVAVGERAGARGAGAAVVSAAEDLPPDAVAYAEGLARAGRYREGVRALFGAAARSLAEAGLVTRTRTRTNGELLAELVPAHPLAAAALRPLSARFEVAWYGHRDPGEPGFAAARASYDAVLRAAASGPEAGDDPA